MATRISIRLEDKVRADLESEARSRNLRLATFLRLLATEFARQAKRKRIREQTEAVGKYIAAHPEAKEFVEFWGTPRIEGL